MWLAIDQCTGAERGRRSLVAAAPQPFADHGNLGRAAAIVVIVEIAANHRRRAHDLEERGGGHGAGNALRSFRAGDREPAWRPRAEIGENALMGAPIEIARI